VEAEPGTRPLTIIDWLKKALRKIFLKHQLVSSTTRAAYQYITVEEQSHAIWNADSVML
jgi:hypothetical protein